MICPQCGSELNIRKLKSGATYALELPDFVTPTMVQRIRDHLDALHLDVKIVIVEAGMRLKELE